MQHRIFAFFCLHLVVVCIFWNQITVHLVPQCVSDACVNVLKYLLCVLVSYYTFRIVKRKWISGQVDTKNKAVFITGCDTGFGHLLAQRLDSAGFDVFAGCLLPAGPGAQQLQEKSSRNLTIIELDVTRSESITKAVEKVRQKLGLNKGLWAVVNNAGILKGFSVDCSEIKNFQDCLDVNSMGPVRITKAFLPLVKDCPIKGARIVNVTSMGGRLSFPYMTPYIMSKFASTGFTECLRHELQAWGIYVIAIEPDLFLTPMADLIVADQHVNDILSRHDEKLKEDYGDEYFKSLKAVKRDLLNLTASTKISRVVDALETAVSAQYPDHTYKPSDNFFAEQFRDVVEMVPISVRDAIIPVIFTYMGLRKPQRMLQK